MMMSTMRREESGMHGLYLRDEIEAVWITIVLLLVVDGAVRRWAAAWRPRRSGADLGGT